MMSDCSTPSESFGRGSTPMQIEDKPSAGRPADSVPTSLGGALRALARHPLRWMIRYWNWKNALLSAIARTSIFFAVNLTASWDSAVDAALTEIFYRAPMVGTLASLSQSFRRVQPAWKASVVIMFALPAIGHGIEFAVHSLRGTARLYESVLVSIVFSMFSAVVRLFPPPARRADRRPWPEAVSPRPGADPSRTLRHAPAQAVAGHVPPARRTPRTAGR